MMFNFSVSEVPSERFLVREDSQTCDYAETVRPCHGDVGFDELACLRSVLQLNASFGREYERVFSEAHAAQKTRSRSHKRCSTRTGGPENSELIKDAAACWLLRAHRPADDARIHRAATSLRP